MTIGDIQPFLPLLQLIVGAVVGLFSWFAKRELGRMWQEIERLKNERKEDTLELKKQLEDIRNAIHESEVASASARAKLDSLDRMLDKALDTQAKTKR